MIKNVFTSYVLPLILSGTSFIMPKDTNLQLYIGYACYVTAILIFGFGLIKNYGERFFPCLYNYWPFKDKKTTATSNFPNVAWLTVEDVMNICDWSFNILKQHIENGLPGYIKISESQERPLDKDRDLIALEEWPEQTDSLTEQWLFKTEDIEKYMKKHNKSLHADEQGRAA